MRAFADAISEFQRAVELSPHRMRHGSRSAPLGWKRERPNAPFRFSPIFRPRRILRPSCGENRSCRAIRRANRSAPGYVRHLFDQFAPTTTGACSRIYRTVRRTSLRGLADMLMIAEPGTLSVLDLGCGTGLSGAVFKDLAARLDGVDLSPKMMEAARTRAIYDELILADIETSLAQDGPAYDLILAADTLVYLGDLSSVLCGARRRLEHSGLFLFTVEKCEAEGYELGPKRRYRHSETYIRQEAVKAGLEVMGFLNCSPRDEAQAPVEGFAVALQPADEGAAAN
jgi:predicted TPR repeat methyltransferase